MGKRKRTRSLFGVHLNGETVYHFMCISPLPSKDQLHLYSSTFFSPETTSNRNFTYLVSFCLSSRHSILPILLYSPLFYTHSMFSISSFTPSKTNFYQYVVTWHYFDLFLSALNKRTYLILITYIEKMIQSKSKYCFRILH